jgi:2'-5' RNA ligase
MEKIRTFIAVDFNNVEVINSILTLQEKITNVEADVKFVEKENLHITLKFLGEVTPSVIANIQKALSEIKFKPFNVVVKGIGAFPNYRNIRVVWVGIEEGVEELKSLQSRIDEELVVLGFKREKDFIPHLTIGRVKSGRNRDKLISILNEFRDFTFGRQLIDTIHLKKSILTSRGPIYSNLYSIKAM